MEACINKTKDEVNFNMNEDDINKDSRETIPIFSQTQFENDFDCEQIVIRPNIEYSFDDNKIINLNIFNKIDRFLANNENILINKKVRLFITKFKECIRNYPNKTMLELAPPLIPMIIDNESLVIQWRTKYALIYFAFEIEDAESSWGVLVNNTNTNLYLSQSNLMDINNYIKIINNSINIIIGNI